MDTMTTSRSDPMAGAYASAEVRSEGAVAEACRKMHTIIALIRDANGITDEALARLQGGAPPHNPGKDGPQRAGELGELFGLIDQAHGSASRALDLAQSVRTL
jgi:hypothetical protein